MLLVIHFAEVNTFGEGISLTAEKGKSLLSRLPIFSSGLDSASADVIEAAFDYQVPEDKEEWHAQDNASGMKLMRRSSRRMFTMAMMERMQS